MASAPLVPYGASDDEGDDGATQLYIAATAPGIHTSLGTARAKPLKGDWLAHVFVPIVDESALGAVFRDAFHALDRAFAKTNTLERIDQPHISLTRPVVLRKHEQDAFFNIARGAVADFASIHVPSSTINIAFARFAVLSGEDGRLAYFAVEIGLGWDALQRLTNCLDAPLQTQLQQRAFFKEARFHASFASVERAQIGEQAINKAVEVLERELGDDLRNCPALLVNRVTASFGNRRVKIQL